MCAEKSSSVEPRQQTLRSELKLWERKFADANGGRKAEKDDIKKHPDIGRRSASSENDLLISTAIKYKEYTKLRSGLCDSNAKKQETPRKSRKRKNEEEQYVTAKHPAVIDPYDIPQSSSSTPTITRTFVGPTPQKNGHVLGLFDMLSPYSNQAITPSKSRLIHTTSDILKDLDQTPSRRKSKAQIPTTQYSTPSSSAKRRHLDITQTPSSQRQHVLTDITPTSTRLNNSTQSCLDETPAFLKRFSEPSAFGGSEDALGKNISYSPPQMRLPRKPVGRSLSQLVRSLRKQEEERLDEEMALMHEIETGEPASLVKDSQVKVGDMPLGADGEHDLSEDGGASVEPRRLWKKKGQKRTTRRANIGVNRTKWKPEVEWKAGDASDVENIPDTQAVDGDGGVIQTSKTARQQKEKNKSKVVKDKNSVTGKGADGKKIRKINPNATSHANFRSLKIRNKNSKGRTGGRFGRR